jgi:glycosyltransferase involved in cell wall biosynthesis
LTAAREQSAEPLNILMAACVPRRREGGVAAMIYNLGRELEANGNRVTYVFHEDLLEPRNYPERFKDWVFARRLSKYIVENRGKFSVVNLHAPAGFVYGRKRRRGGKDLPPYVMTLHGLEERRVRVMTREDKKGRAWHFALKNRLWHRAYIWPRFRASIRTADACHSFTREVWNCLELDYNVPPERNIFIPTGVESRFNGPRNYESNGALKLLYAGTWLDQRGIFYLREALERLAPQLPGLTMNFAGGGCPPEVIRDFFGPKLASTIVVTPVVESGKMQELYAAHDVFLFPSLMEGLPSVLIEAMASGMPVITAETCGMPDVVEDDFNGLLVTPADSKAIEDAVLRLARSPELRRRLGQQAQQTMARYTWKRSAQKLENVFRAAIARDAGITS